LVKIIFAQKSLWHWCRTTIGQNFSSVNTQGTILIFVKIARFSQKGKCNANTILTSSRNGTAIQINTYDVYFNSIREKISSLSAVVYFGMAQSLDKDVLVINLHMRRQRPSLSACEEFIFAAKESGKNAARGKGFGVLTFFLNNPRKSAWAYAFPRQRVF
jgi:hypothetical protein